MALTNVNLFNRWAGASRQGQSALERVLELFGSGYGKGMEQTGLANIGAEFAERGLANTTAPVTASARFKSELEDIRRSRLADALTNLSSYFQRDASTMASLSTSNLPNLVNRQTTNRPSYAPTGIFASHYLPQPHGSSRTYY